jgi:AbrB family looped-hinge helix DNA binding protein
MIATINVSTKRQVVLPKAFCDRKNIQPGSSLRVVEVGDGLYVSAIPEPTEAELRRVLREAGSHSKPQTAAEAERVERVIAGVRRRRKK